MNNYKSLIKIDRITKYISKIIIYKNRKIRLIKRISTRIKTRVKLKQLIYKTTNLNKI